MDTWTPLWSCVVGSSLWHEPGDVVKVFMTMLAKKDADHICQMDAFAIACACHFKRPDGGVDELKVLDILKILASPDRHRQMPQEHEGRRIKAVEGGWLILNGEKYRQAVSKQMTRARNAKASREYRLRKKGKPLPGEEAYLKAQREGASQEALERMEDETSLRETPLEYKVDTVAVAAAESSSNP